MKRLFTFIFCLFYSFALIAQTTADSLTLATAQWEITHLQKGIICKQASFLSLYGVPQHISILEISPKKFKFSIQIHNGMKRTSEISQAAQAIAAINGSYYSIKKGNSVCYLQKGGIMIDTTSTSVIYTRCNGAIHIKKGKLRLIPWNKEIEQKTKQKVNKAEILASGPLFLTKSKPNDLSQLDSSFIYTKHPRSGIILTKDKKVLLIVVDGRQKGKSEGINIAEFAHLAQQLGGIDALNIDGGGSSTLWSAAMPKTGVINTPSDKSGEREVANSIGVFFK